MTAVDRREPPANRDPAATYDFLYRKQPQRFGFVQLARGIPGFAALFTGRVPGEFFAQVDDDVVEVSCPCGHQPRLERMAPTRCNCDRAFVYDGREVRVARDVGMSNR